MSGCLYIISTPIGNMEDITLRALNALKNADVIVVENFEVTERLLEYHEIKDKFLIRYSRHNAAENNVKILSHLKNGETLALVCDAGTPGIADPGSDIIKLCIENGIPVTSIPGPVAAVCALILSGASACPFIFEGFLPVSKTSRKKHLDLLKTETRTIVIYEAYKKLLCTLQDIMDSLGDKNISLACDLTKPTEIIYHDSISNLIKYFSKKLPYGEFVIVI